VARQRPACQRDGWPAGWRCNRAAWSRAGLSGSSNGVFTEISSQHAGRLAADWNFQVWSERADERCVVRWMTAFDTSAADVERLAAAIKTTAVSRET
jgi:threonine aldolase